MSETMLWETLGQEHFFNMAKEFKLNHLMITVAKRATSHHITHNTISIYKQQI